MIIIIIWFRHISTSHSLSPTKSSDHAARCPWQWWYPSPFLTWRSVKDGWTATCRIMLWKIHKSWNFLRYQRLTYGLCLYLSRCGWVSWKNHQTCWPNTKGLSISIIKTCNFTWWMVTSCEAANGSDQLVGYLNFWRGCWDWHPKNRKLMKIVGALKFCKKEKITIVHLCRIIKVR